MIMIQLEPQLRILLACAPIDFRKGIDSLVALCQGPLAQNAPRGSLCRMRDNAPLLNKPEIYPLDGRLQSTIGTMLGFQVDSLDKLVGRLAEIGVRILKPPMKRESLPTIRQKWLLLGISS